MKNIKKNELQEIIVELSKQGAKGLGFLFDNSIWICPQNCSPISKFCRMANDKKANQSCISFYEQFSDKDRYLISVCPFGCKMCILPISDLCKKRALVFMQMTTGKENCFDAEKWISTFPRKTKKFLMNTFKEVKVWNNTHEKNVIEMLEYIYTRACSLSEEKRDSVIESLFNEYGDFVAYFSHEALSPMQQIRLTLERAALKTEVENREAFDLIQSAQFGLDRIRVLLEGMRLLFRSDSPNSNTILANQYRSLDALEVFRHWLRLYETQISSKNIRVIFEPEKSPWTIWVVKEYFEVLVRNLISNAIKYSFDASNYDKEGKIILRFDRHENSISVINYGVPIETKEISHQSLFRPGSRGEKSSDRGRDGRGVGLYLVKLIADLHGAKMDIQSSIQNPGGYQEFSKNEFRIRFKRRSRARFIYKVER